MNSACNEKTAIIKKEMEEKPEEVDRELNL